MEVSVKQRLIQFIKYKGISQRKFENMINVSNGFINNISKSIGAEKLYRIQSIFPELNDAWLLTGEGSMLNEEESPPLSATKSISDNDNDSLCDYITYLLPMSTHGGSFTGIPAEATLLQGCEKIISPIKGVDFAISIYGDSMAPEYPSGSRVLIKKINHNAYIDWGKAYVIDTCNGVIIKEILKCQREGFITCHSINPDPKFADFDLSLNDVYGIYRVLMCLSAK